MCLLTCPPLSLKGALTSLGSYKKSCTSFTRPFALASVDVKSVFFGSFFGALLVFGLVWSIAFGVLHFGVFLSPTFTLRDYGEFFIE